MDKLLHSYQALTMTQGAIGIFVALFIIALICVAADGRHK